MKQQLLIHCSREHIECWWMYENLYGLCGARIVCIGNINAGETEWHLSGSPMDFVSYSEEETYAKHYWKVMTDRGFDFYQYDVALCEHCLSHEDLTLLALSRVGA